MDNLKFISLIFPTQKDKVFFFACNLSKGLSQYVQQNALSIGEYLCFERSAATANYIDYINYYVEQVKAIESIVLSLHMVEDNSDWYLLRQQIVSRAKRVTTLTQQELREIATLKKEGYIKNDREKETAYNFLLTIGLSLQDFKTNVVDNVSMIASVNQDVLWKCWKISKSLFHKDENINVADWSAEYTKNIRQNLINYQNYLINSYKEVYKSYAGYYNAEVDFTLINNFYENIILLCDKNIMMQELPSFEKENFNISKNKIKL